MFQNWKLKYWVFMYIFYLVNPHFLLGMPLDKVKERWMDGWMDKGVFFQKEIADHIKQIF